MRRLCRFSLPRDGFELLDLVLMLHAAHKALAVDRVAAVAGKAFAPILRAAFELCGKVRLADERVQIERRLLPRAAVEVDAEMACDDKARFVFRKLDERIRPERRHRTLFVRQMLVRRRADDAVFKLARAELCRGKQKAIIVSPYKIRSAMNIISGIVTGSSRFDCSTLLLAISGERS